MLESSWFHIVILFRSFTCLSCIDYTSDTPKRQSYEFAWKVSFLNSPQATQERTREVEKVKA